MFLARDGIHSIKYRLPDAQVFHWSVISGVEMGIGSRRTDFESAPFQHSGFL